MPCGPYFRERVRTKGIGVFVPARTRIIEPLNHLFHELIGGRFAGHAAAEQLAQICQRFKADFKMAIAARKADLSRSPGDGRAVAKNMGPREFSGLPVRSCVAYYKNGVMGSFFQRIDGYFQCEENGDTVPFYCVEGRALICVTYRTYQC